MTVLPEDVRTHGPTAAIVLAVLRDLGCSATVPVLIQYAAIGRSCGLEYRAVSRALSTLSRHRMVRVERYRVLAGLMVRMTHVRDGATDVDGQMQSNTTQVGQGSIAQEPPSIERLDSVRSILDAVG